MEGISWTGLVEPKRHHHGATLLIFEHFQEVERYVALSKESMEANRKMEAVKKGIEVSSWPMGVCSYLTVRSELADLDNLIRGKRKRRQGQQNEEVLQHGRRRSDWRSCAGFRAAVHSSIGVSSAQSGSNCALECFWQKMWVKIRGNTSGE